jgi:hypothetical protein
MTEHRSVALAAVILASASAASAQTPAPPPTRTLMENTAVRLDGGRHDFDFLVGKWRVKNRRLKERFAGSKEWVEFEATSTSHAILDGIGNVDEIRIPSTGKAGVTLALFDPAKEIWTLYWVTREEGVLQPPLTGRFYNGTGEFYGDDVDGSRPVRVRYLWTGVSKRAARWEQAFSIDGGATWETNWVMDFVRAGR